MEDDTELSQRLRLLERIRSQWWGWKVSALVGEMISESWRLPYSGSSLLLCFQHSIFLCLGFQPCQIGIFFVAWRLHHSADSISSVCLGVQTLGPFSLEKSFKIPMRRHSWCRLPAWSVSTCILWTVCFLDFSFSVAWWSLRTEALAHGKWLFQCVALSGSLLFSHTGSFYKDFILYQPIKNKLGLK